MKKEIKLKIKVTHLVSILLVVSSWTLINYTVDLSSLSGKLLTLFILLTAGVMFFLFRAKLKASNKKSWQGAQNLLSESNVGIYQRLRLGESQPTAIDATDITRVFGIHGDKQARESVQYERKEANNKHDVDYNCGQFISYDSAAIPFYELLPKDFDPIMRGYDEINLS